MQGVRTFSICAELMIPIPHRPGAICIALRGFHRLKVSVVAAFRILLQDTER